MFLGIRKCGCHLSTAHIPRSAGKYEGGPVTALTMPESMAGDLPLKKHVVGVHPAVYASTPRPESRMDCLKISLSFTPREDRQILSFY